MNVIVSRRGPLLWTAKVMSGPHHMVTLYTMTRRGAWRAAERALRRRAAANYPVWPGGIIPICARGLDPCTEVCPTTYSCLRK